MKLLPLYFENHDNHVNGLSKSEIGYISKVTQQDCNIILHPKSLFSIPTAHCKNKFWTPVTDHKQYFYPISCVPPLGQFADNNNRYTAYSLITIPTKVIADCQAGNCAVLLYETWEGDPWWHYMEMITNICMNNDGLRPKHFIMLSGNMNMPTDIPYKHVAMTWLQTLLQPNADLESAQQRIDTLTIRKDRFLCMNRRPAPHRLALLYHLWEYRDQGAMSFDIWETSMPEVYTETLQKFNINDLSLLEEIQQALPIRLCDGVDVSSNPVIDTSAQKFHESHLHVVAETYYGCSDAEHSMFFSEKMFKPMQYLQPFVVLNYPHSLKELHRQGYQTFDRWLDEGYDTIVNLDDRTCAVAQVVKDMCTHTPAAMAGTHKEMLPVLEHNYHQRVINTEAINNNMYDVLHAALNSTI